MDDEPKVQQLENRIDSLESTIEKMMPSRRDALKMGGAALAGGSLMAGTASAGTNQRGTIGSPSELVDIESEDINNADTVTTENLVVNNSSTTPDDVQSARVFLSSDFSLPNNSREIVPFDAIQYDEGNNFISGSGFEVPKTGIYLSRLTLDFAGGSASDSRQVIIGDGSNPFVSSRGSELGVLDNGAQTVTNISKYPAGTIIHGHAKNFDSSDIITSGGIGIANSRFSVAFLGGV